MKLPGPAGKDAFALSGILNMPFTANVPETVTLTIDDWSVVMDSSSWTRAGTANVYTCKEGGISAKMTYWVKGTTKCLFSFTATNQTLQGHVPNWPDVPVRLRLGSDFDETLTANLAVKGTAGKLSSLGPLPLFCTEKLTVKRNLRLAGHDALSLSGKVFLDSDFDPSEDDLTMHVGPYELLIPAGTTYVPTNGIVKYTAATPSGKMAFQLNNNTHALSVTATGVNMSSVTEDIEVSLSITNHPGAVWNCGLRMARNITGTAYTY